MTARWKTGIRLIENMGVTSARYLGPYDQPPDQFNIANSNMIGKGITLRYRNSGSVFLFQNKIIPTKENKKIGE